jgi:hypothetical protein
MTEENEAVCSCGRRATSHTVTANLNEEGRARFGGVQTCGSVWMCPVCHHAIMSGRREEIAAGGDDFIKEYPAGAAYLGTFTLRHRKFDDAKETRKAVLASWRRMLTGKPWQAAAKRYGCVMWVRSLEVTFGDSGWHPHIHAVFFVKDPDGVDEDGVVIPGARAEAFGTWLFERWATMVAREGYGKCSFNAWSWERAASRDAVTGYLTKGGFDSELTGAGVKKAAVGHYTPWQLLDKGDPASLKIFHEYALAFKGARCITFSRGFRAEEQGEMELAEAAPVGDQVGEMPSKVFNRIVFYGLYDDVLDVIETKGWAGATTMLARAGITWT